MADPSIELEAYALVTAGLADGLPMQELLAHVGIDGDTWSTASAQWDDVMLDSLDDGVELALRLDELQRLAREKWQRRLEPIESDLDSWVAFEQSYSTHLNPATFLHHHGVSIAELARLSSKWADRLAADDSLRERAGQLRDNPPALVELAPASRPPLAPAASLHEASHTGLVHAFTDEAAQSDPASQIKRPAGSVAAVQHSPAPPPLQDLPLPPASHAPQPAAKQLGRFSMGGGLDVTINVPSFDEVLKPDNSVPFSPITPAATRRQTENTQPAATPGRLEDVPAAMPPPVPVIALASAPQAPPAVLSAFQPASGQPLTGHPRAARAVAVQLPPHIADIVETTSSRSLDATAALDGRALVLDALPFLLQGQPTGGTVQPSQAVATPAPQAAAYRDPLKRNANVDTTGILNIDQLAPNALPFSDSDVAESPHEATVMLDELPAELAMLANPFDRSPARKTVTSTEETQSLEALATAARAQSHGQPPPSNHHATPQDGPQSGDMNAIEAPFDNMFVGPVYGSNRRLPLVVFAPMMVSIERARPLKQHGVLLARLGLTEAEYRRLYAQVEPQLITEALRLAWATLCQRIAGSGQGEFASTTAEDHRGGHR